MSDLQALVDTALRDSKENEGGELEKILGITRICEEIALRAELDDAVLEDADLFGLVAYGTTALGGLLLRSIEAEERGDAIVREQVDEVGSRLQHVTVELARLCARGN